MNKDSHFACPKEHRVRDRKHLDRVKALPCMMCGAMGCDPQHLKRAVKIKGTGLKPGDDWTVPHCRPCHNKAETYPKGEIAFYEDMGIPYQIVKNYAQTLYAGDYRPFHTK